jgi:membrane protein DedA with SNARE-associated domain
MTISIIGLIIWESLVIYLAYGYLKLLQTNAKANLDGLGALLIFLFIFVGLAILPFTGAITPE